MEFRKISSIKLVIIACLLMGLILAGVNPKGVQAEENRAGGEISGQVTCLGFISGATNEVFVDIHLNTSSPPEETIHITCNQSYQFTDVPDGTYYIGTWLDENDTGGGPPDTGEPHTWYPDPIVISSTTPSYTDTNLELARYIERVSLFGSKDIPQQENWDSEEPAISGDGRYVVFSANEGSINRGVHIFDRELDTSNWFSETDHFDFFYEPDISADGDYVAAAYYHHPIEEDPIIELIVKEWADEYSTPTVIVPWESDSPYFKAPSISGNGCRVAFEFKYENTLGSDVRDVYLYDCDSEETSLISVSANGTDPGNDQSYDPAISDDGLFVAFKSRATDLINPPPALSGNLIYVRDIEAGTTELVPLPEGVSGGDFNDAPSISGDGRYVAFEYNYEVYIHDRQTGETRMISYINGEPSGDSEDPSISADGRFVTYTTFRYVESDYFADIFVNDLETGTLKMATKGFDGMPNLDSGYYPVISEDGHFIAFQADASDLVVDDTNGTRDVFVYMNAPTLTVDILGLGAVDKDPDQSTYDFDEVVILTPLPDEGFAFDGWTGADAADLVDNGNGTWSITMDDFKFITANFVVASFDIYLPIILR